MFMNRSISKAAVIGLSCMSTLLSGCQATRDDSVPITDPEPGKREMLVTGSRPTSMPADDRFTLSHGGIIRGPRDDKHMSLVFTGGSFGEGTQHILDELAQRKIKASFFVTGDYIRVPEHRPLLRRMIAEGHYVGPHSDAHLLYSPWEDRSKTLVTREQFREDLEKNLDDLVALGAAREGMRYFIPPYEWYNQQIVDWAAEMGLVVFSFTPGTRSNADYLPDADRRFVSSEQIYRGILEYESGRPDGLRGFLLLLHLGVGPQRTDKMHRFLGQLLDELVSRGYSVVRVDELLGSDASPAASGGRR
jgi:endoglucanase